MDRHGADIHDLLVELELDDVTLVGPVDGRQRDLGARAQFGAAGIRDVVIVDQTPKMLNADDWAFGFYDYDATNVDTYVRHRASPTPAGTPRRSKGLVRIARVLKAMELPKGGKPTFTEAELALLNDHAKRDWRPVGRRARPARVLHRRRRERVLAGRARRGIRCPEPARPRSTVIERDGHAANIEQPQRFNEALLGFLGAEAGPAGCDARPADRAASPPGAHPVLASRCARCTASPTHSELSYTRSGPRRSSRPPASSWSAIRSPAITSHSVESCCSRSSR